MAWASRSKRSLNWASENLIATSPVQTRIPGTIHLSHSTRTEERKDFVRAEFISSRKRHMGNWAQCSPS